MITKMKKLTFLVYHKEYETFLNGVRDLGVVHVAEKQQGVDDKTDPPAPPRLTRPPSVSPRAPLQTRPLQKIPRPQSGDFATYFGIIPRRELLPQRAPPRGPHPPVAP